MRQINDVIREIEEKSLLPLTLLDVIHFDRPKGLEWLNNVFQRHIISLESDLLEAGHFTFGPPPRPPSLRPGQWKTGYGKVSILEKVQ